MPRQRGSRTEPYFFMGRAWRCAGHNTCAMTPDAPDKAATPLFRQEALAARRAPQHGEIVLMPGASSRWTALAALCVVLALALLIGLGTYTRRSTVGGQLFPSEGLIRVTAAQPGVVV